MEIKKLYDSFRYDISAAHLRGVLLKDIDKFILKSKSVKKAITVFLKHLKHLR